MVNCSKPTERVNLSKKATCILLNGFCMGTRIRKLLQRNFYRNIDHAFAFVVVFVDESKWCTQSAPMTVKHAKCSELNILFVMLQKLNRIKAVQLTSTRDEVTKLMMLESETF